MLALAIRIAVIIVAVCTAIVLYSYVINPYVLQPLCLINSNSCARMSYYKYNNSALAKMDNSGLWLWFNGDRAYVYGQPVGQLCSDPSTYEAAYAINTQNGLKEGYTCVKTLSSVIDFYKSKGVALEHLVVKADPKTFDVYSALNTLHQNNIINLQEVN